MHRHGEQPLGQRGNKANALQAAKQQSAATTPTSLARTQHSATTANNPPYQSAVAQLAQSRQVLQPVAQTVCIYKLSVLIENPIMFISTLDSRSRWQYHRPRW